MVMSYPPEGEDSALLYIEHTNLLSATFSALAYGVHSVIFFSTLQAVVRRLRQGADAFGILAYIVTMWVLATIYWALYVSRVEDMYINMRGYPGKTYEDGSQGIGGPLGVWIDIGGPVLTATQSMFIIINALADGLVIYRAFVVWNRSWLVIAFPILMYLGAVATSCLTVFQQSRPDADFFNDISLSFGIPYFSLSLALNVILTGMIAGRILSAKSPIQNAIGRKNAKSFVGILVESSVLYSATNIIFLAFFVRGDAFVNILLPLLAQIMCISPLLIVKRVAKGEAFSTDLIVGEATAGPGTVMDAPTLRGSTSSRDEKAEMA